MVGILLGLLGACAMAGGAKLGSALQDKHQAQSPGFGGSSGGGSSGSSPGAGYGGSYGGGSDYGISGSPVWRFNKRTGEFERV